MLRVFYTFMLWATQFELTIAEHTSTNHRYVSHCRERLRYWQHEEWLYERGMR